MRCVVNVKISFLFFFNKINIGAWGASEESNRTAGRELNLNSPVCDTVPNLRITKQFGISKTSIYCVACTRNPIGVIWFSSRRTVLNYAHLMCIARVTLPVTCHFELPHTEGKLTWVIITDITFLNIHLTHKSLIGVCSEVVFAVQLMSKSRL